MGDLLFPLVQWAQDQKNIFLKVELQKVEDYSINVSKSKLEFQAIGVGARGRNQYYFGLNLYGVIDSDNYICKVDESCLNIQLQKEANSSSSDAKPRCFWPRLTEMNEKYHWLKIDFDKWQDSDDSDSDSTKKQKNMFNDFDVDAYEKEQADEVVRQMMMDKQDLDFGFNFSLTKPYLITYNVAMFLGYFLILISLSVGYYTESSDYFPKTWSEIGGKMFCCQIAQFLEIAHVLLGYVKGSALATTLQTFGRGFVLFIILNGESRMHDKPFVFYLFLLWSLVEVIRYPYYISSLLNKRIGLLTWLRYSVWVILYPLGFLCEGVIILRAMPYYEETQRYSNQLPNRFNMAFDFPSILKLYLLFVFLPGIALLVSHMRQQRLKKLSKKKRT